jgi:hypothetical protein
MDNGMPVRYFIGLYGAGTHRLMGGHAAHFATRRSFHVFIQRSAKDEAALLALLPGPARRLADWAGGDLAAHAEAKGWQIVYTVDESVHSSTIGAGIVPHDDHGMVAHGAKPTRWKRSGPMQYIDVKVPGYSAQHRKNKLIFLTSLQAFPHLLYTDMEYGETDEVAVGASTSRSTAGNTAISERAQMGRVAGGAMITLTLDGCQLHLGNLAPSVYQPNKRHPGQVGHLSLNWLTYAPQLDCSVSGWGDWEAGCECRSSPDYIDPSSYSGRRRLLFKPHALSTLAVKMGYQMRTRTVLHKADSLGEKCAHLKEVRECTASAIVNSGCKAPGNTEGEVPKQQDDLIRKEAKLRVVHAKEKVAAKQKALLQRLKASPTCAKMATACTGQLFFEIGIDQGAVGQFSADMKSRILVGAQQLCNINPADATLALAHGSRGAFLNLRVSCDVASLSLAQDLLTAVRTTIFVDQFCHQISTYRRDVCHP